MLNIVNMWHKLKSYNFSLTGGLIQTNTKKVFRDIHLQYMLHKSTVLSLIVNCRLIHCRLKTCSRDESILFFTNPHKNLSMVFQPASFRLKNVCCSYHLVFLDSKKCNLRMRISERTSTL